MKFTIEILNRSKYIILGFFLLSSVVFAENNKLELAINSLIDRDLPNAFVGVVVKNSDNEIYYKRNANKHFIPASNAKLFTCTAAMLDLGKDFKYTTAFKLYKSLINNRTLNGNLYIKFTGDPSYTRDDLHQNLMQLMQLGIKSIRGNILLDNTNYSDSHYAPGISYDDLGLSYAAPVSSIILDGNLLHLDIQGGNNVGSSAEILWGPQNRYFKIDNNIVTVAKSYNEDDNADISIQMDNNNHIELTGTISTNYKKEKVAAIKNPFKYAGDVIEAELRKCNIRFDKKIIAGKTPPNTDPVVVNASDPLPVLIKHALKGSDNLYVDSFLKTMGAQRNGIGTYKVGLRVLAETIGQLTNINFENLQLYDGSGLSRYNLVTPEQITDLLTAVYNNEELSGYIIDALPVSGKDGTLKDRMKSKKIKGHVKAKTGSMGGISALSGYIFIDRGSPVIFSIITNGVVNKKYPGVKKNFEDALCELLLKYFSN